MSTSYPPFKQAVQVGLKELTPEQEIVRYQERYTDLQKLAFPLLESGLRSHSEQLWENFLNDRTLLSFQPVLIHCDLACEHILCDPGRGRLTGVIDWGDVSIGDSALDFVGLYVYHGEKFTENVVSHYQGNIDAAFWRRMDFYVRYGPFSDLSRATQPC